MTAEKAWEAILDADFDSDKEIAAISAYGDERKAKGYREGVEACLKLARQGQLVLEGHNCVPLNFIETQFPSLLKGAPK